MARFSIVPKAELGAPPAGTVFASEYNRAVDLIERVYRGDLRVLDTTKQDIGEGILENISDEMPSDDGE